MGIKRILGFWVLSQHLHLYTLCGCAMCFRHMERRDLMPGGKYGAAVACFAEYIGRAVYTYHNADALYRGLLVSLFVLQCLNT